MRQVTPPTISDPADAVSDKFNDKKLNAAGRWVSRVGKSRKGEWALARFRVVEIHDNHAKLVLMSVMQWSKSPATILKGYESHVRFSQTRGYNQLFMAIGTYARAVPSKDSEVQVIQVRRVPFWSIEYQHNWKVEGEP